MVKSLWTVLFILPVFSGNLGTRSLAESEDERGGADTLKRGHGGKGKNEWTAVAEGLPGCTQVHGVKVGEPT